MEYDYTTIRHTDLYSTYISVQYTYIPIQYIYLFIPNAIKMYETHFHSVRNGSFRWEYGSLATQTLWFLTWHFMYFY
jgi:hypothetical protein